uniref:Insulin-degrading enzyme n=1 Tax=Globisporangium ultimum (strain ATCC 200006 / CBS 805.95 / DAOM BR144) TaxID=431595 RepID=K3W5F3_GLOUD
MDSVGGCNGIDVSALDERAYECVELSNSLQVLLISDPKTEKASAAMDVHVGHQSDPVELPGLAHFLEHMLFLGTEKYPDENSYKQFLSAHSGRSNASTSQMHTNYYFDVLSDHFQEALDRFAQFFIAPLFTASATEREMHAVNSENAKNLQNDHRRLYQLEKCLSNPDHPFHKFGTGNIDTLGNIPKEKGIDVRKALLEFHETYYSASIMKLVIYGKEDLATLAQWAKNLFSSVKNTGRGFPKFGGAVPYDETRLARQVHVAPVKDLRVIALSWPLPSLYWEFLTKPSKILSHLLGHEGKGSILSYLKAQKWANGLSAGLMRDNEDWSLFSVKVDATDAGIEHVDDVVSAVYQYLRLLQKKTPFASWIFKETQDIGLIDFRFKSKESPINYTSYLASVMHRYPTKYVVSGGYLLYGYDAGKVQEILGSLTPRRMRLTVVSKTFEGKTTSVEKWYETPYSEFAIDEATLLKWESVKGNRELQMPHRNEFICSDFDIVTPPPTPADAAYESTPELLEKDERYRLWFKPDTQFRKPKLTLSFLFYSPVVSSTPYHAVLTSLFIRYLKDELTECSYDAELAGMEYEISFNSRAIELYAGGFSHKLSSLLFKVLNVMMSLTKDKYSFQDAIFERVKDRTKRMYENFFLEEPYQHAVYGSSLLLESAKWSVEDKIQAIQCLTVRDLSAHAQVLFQQVFIEGFFYGNLQRSVAPVLMQSVIKEFRFGTSKGSFSILPSQASKPRVVQLADATEYCYQRKEWNPDNLNSSICTLYQVQEESMELRARLELFAHIFKEPCFNQLRTQEQLGYLVFSGLMRTEGIEYFRILIQSNVASPVLLDQRIELFVASFRDLLATMVPETWQKQINAVVKALLEKPKRESEECMRFWREIANETFVFDRRQRVAALVATLHKNDLLEFFDTYIAVSGSKRSKLSVCLYGAAHQFPELAGGDDGKQVSALTASMTGLSASLALTPASPASIQLIRDIEAFKRRMPLFPERSHDGLAAATNARL